MSSRVKFLVGLVAFTIILRLLPYVLTAYNMTVDPTVIFYPWNFVPLMGICLYSGAYVEDRRWSIVVPVLTLLISDLGIWALTGQFSWAFPSDRWSVYLCYLIAVSMGRGLNSRPWPARAFYAFGLGMLAELNFFLVTNFAYFLTQTVFPQSLDGLISCYVVAIPFAGKSLASTAFFSVLLFSPLAIRAAGGSSSQQPAMQSALSR